MNYPLFIQDGLTRVAIVPIGPFGPSQRRSGETLAIQTLLRLMCHARDVSLTHDSDGAPYASGIDINISVSHSRTYAALALNQVDRIGIDLEEPRTKLRRVANRLVTPHDDPVWADYLLEAWTAKEAVFKAAHIPDLTMGEIWLEAPEKARGHAHDKDFALRWHSPLIEPHHVLAVATPV